MLKNDFRLVYVSNTRLPTEKAHGLATMKLCEAFANQGVSVDLVVPRLWRKAKADPFSYYAVKKPFSIRRIWTLDLMELGLFEPVAFLVQMISFSLLAAAVCFMRCNLKRTIFISHDYMPLYFLSFFAPIYYDIHHYPGRNFMYRRVMKKAIGFAVQTKWKIKQLIADFGIEERKVIYWPNGTDLSEFDTTLSRREARDRLGVSQEKTVVLYTGQLFSWKGVDTLLGAVPRLSEDVLMYIVGGDARDIDETKRRRKEANDRRIIFTGFRPHADIPLWLAAANVAVLPNTGKQKVSKYYTSPMKLFEYMASGTPVVASRIPSVCEIVGEDEVFFADPDDPGSFARAIRDVVAAPDEAMKRSERARRKVASFTWDERASRILAHIIDLRK